MEEKRNPREHEELDPGCQKRPDPSKLFGVGGRAYAESAAWVTMEGTTEEKRNPGEHEELDPRYQKRLDASKFFVVGDRKSVV